MSWPRPVPTIGDVTTAAARAAAPRSWRFPDADIDALHRILAGRRDVRRFRPEPVEPPLIRRILAAGHAAPSVGHSQPWRFVLVTDPSTRQRAALLSDEQRLAQAAVLEEGAARHMLDLDLEGIREAPIGIVVCCDRRVAAPGVLGRATFTDADLWSCACAIENLWLAARAEGLGVGWVTLFRPDDLSALVSAPTGVSTLGWLCVGWPDERPPEPGLERRGWSRRLPLDAVVIDERWPAEGPAAPVSRLAGEVTGPAPAAVVGARDDADLLLTSPGSLGALDRALDRVAANGLDAAAAGTLVLVAADHPVTRHGVSAYSPKVTREVAEAAVAGRALGAVAAAQAGLAVLVVDAGIDGPTLPGSLGARPRHAVGDLAVADALTLADARRLVRSGRRIGAQMAASGLVVLGEIGIGNTTVAAGLAALCLDIEPSRAVGLGTSASRAVIDAKVAVVERLVARVQHRGPMSPMELLATAGGGEIAVLTGVVLGAAGAGGVVILDGLATSVAALLATREQPAVASHLVAGQRSRETAHAAVLGALGLEPLLDLRIRAGEGAGASFAAGLLLSALRVRAGTARVEERSG